MPYCRTLALLCLFVAILWAATGPPAAAFVPVGSGARWIQLPVAYKIHKGGLGSTGNGSEFIAVQAAFDTWQDVTGSRIAFSYQGMTTAQNGGNDGTNLVSFQDETFGFGSGVIAVTLSSFVTVDNSVVFLDTDVLFNPNLDFSTNGAPDAFDVQAIATHEIGHVLGLDHTAIVSASMNPTGARGRIAGRVLQSDDQTGSSVLYPQPGFTNSTAAIAGRITLSGSSVFGAHLVALDEAGRAVTSTLSLKNGTYRIAGLAPGSYSIYAEPLDGPITEASIGGQFDSTVDSNFTTTFLGDTLDASARQQLPVTSGNLLTGLDISVSPFSSSPLNIFGPRLGLRLSQASADSLVALGSGFDTSSGFFLLGGGVVVEAPMLTGSSIAELNLISEATAAVGPRCLFVQNPGALAALSGGVVVTSASPQITAAVPDFGARAGGTPVTISGSNFQSGASVSLDGMPLTDLTWLNSETFEGTTAPNRCGALTLLVVNPDGSSTRLESAYDSVAPTPTIDSVFPVSGAATSLVTISGTNFDPVAGNNQVRFNDRLADVISGGESQIVAVVPFGATSGPVSVETCGQIATGSRFAVIPAGPSPNRAEPRFSYQDIAQDPGATQLVFEPDELGRIDDDSISQLNLPFKFTLFTKTFPEGSPMNISSNGWISLSPSVPISAEWENGPLPGKTLVRPDGSIGLTPANLIAPFYHDLVLQRSDSGVFTRLVGSAPNRRLICEWKNLSLYNGPEVDPSTQVTFQAVLYERSNDIAFLYQTLQGELSRGDSATVGLQNVNRDQAIQFGFNRPRLSAGKSVLFRFNPQDGSYSFEHFLLLVTDSAEFRTNLGLTADTLAGSSVQLRLFDASGQPFGSAAVTVPAGGVIQLNHLIRFVLGTVTTEPSNLSGSVLIASDQLVFPYVTQIDNRSDDASLDVGVMSGATQLLIPSTTSVNQFRSSLVVLNIGDVMAPVTLVQRDRGGKVLHQEEIVIAPRALFQREDVHASFGLGDVFGPLEILSTNDVPLIASSRVYSLGSRVSGWFRGLDRGSGSTNVIVPVSQDSSDFRRNLGINNLADDPASVAVAMLDRHGVILGTRNVQVPPRGLLQLNGVNRELSGSSHESDTLAWIQLSADQPIAGFISQIHNLSDDPGFIGSGVLGATNLLIPSSTNVQQFRSTMTIINAGNERTVSARVRVRNSQGQMIGQSEMISIPPNGTYQVQDLLGSLDVAGDFGPVEIESLTKLPIFVVSRVYSISDGAGGFFLAHPF